MALKHIVFLIVIFVFACGANAADPAPLEILTPPIAGEEAFIAKVPGHNPEKSVIFIPSNHGVPLSKVHPNIIKAILNSDVLIVESGSEWLGGVRSTAKQKRIESILQYYPINTLLTAGLIKDTPFLVNGKPWTEILDKETRKFLEDATGQYLGNQPLSHLAPILIKQALEELQTMDTDRLLGMDYKLRNIFTHANKSIFGLEASKTYESPTQAESDSLLSFLAKEPNYINSEIKKYIDYSPELYLSPNAIKQEYSIGDQHLRMNPEILNKHNASAIERSYRWIPKLLEHLQKNKDKSIAIVVGAAHFHGPDGLIAILQKSPYNFTFKKFGGPVSTSKPAKTPGESKVKSEQWLKILNDLDKSESNKSSSTKTTKSEEERLENLRLKYKNMNLELKTRQLYIKTINEINKENENTTQHINKIISELKESLLKNEKLSESTYASMKDYESYLASTKIKVDQNERKIIWDEETINLPDAPFISLPEILAPLFKNAKEISGKTKDAIKRATDTLEILKNQYIRKKNNDNRNKLLNIQESVKPHIGDPKNQLQPFTVSLQVIANLIKSSKDQVQLIEQETIKNEQELEKLFPFAQSEDEKALINEGKESTKAVKASIQIASTLINYLNIKLERLSSHDSTSSAQKKKNDIKPEEESNVSKITQINNMKNEIITKLTSINNSIIPHLDTPGKPGQPFNVSFKDISELIESSKKQLAAIEQEINKMEQELKNILPKLPPEQQTMLTQLMGKPRKDKEEVTTVFLKALERKFERLSKEKS